MSEKLEVRYGELRIVCPVDSIDEVIKILEFVLSTQETKKRTE